MGGREVWAVVHLALIQMLMVVLSTLQTFAGLMCHPFVASAFPPPTTFQLFHLDPVVLALKVHRLSQWWEVILCVEVTERNWTYVLENIPYEVGWINFEYFFLIQYVFIYFMKRMTVSSSIFQVRDFSPLKGYECVGMSGCECVRSIEVAYAAAVVLLSYVSFVLIFTQLWLKVAFKMF